MSVITVFRNQVSIALVQDQTDILRISDRLQRILYHLLWGFFRFNYEYDLASLPGQDLRGGIQ
jgi:hypothetical protein